MCFENLLNDGIKIYETTHAAQSCFVLTKWVNSMFHCTKIIYKVRELSLSCGDYRFIFFFIFKCIF